MTRITSYNVCYTKLLRSTDQWRLGEPLPLDIQLVYSSVPAQPGGQSLHIVAQSEDAASTDHYSGYSTIDYNRAGVPLLELVTEPDFHSAIEAVSFLETMRTIYQYAGISEADSRKGQLRCDVNVSIMDIDKDEKNPDNWGSYNFV